MVQAITFAIAAMACLAGAIGVIGFRNPVHNALSLVGTLFGVAVLFVASGAYFLAAVQIIVYAGAVVVVFLFVIMLLGVDRIERMEADPLPRQRVLAAAVAGGLGLVLLVALLATGEAATGQRGTGLQGRDINDLARQLFTRHVWAFEITSVLLTIAVASAVMLARRHDEAPIDDAAYPLSESIFDDDDHHGDTSVAWEIAGRGDDEAADVEEGDDGSLEPVDTVVGEEPS